MDSVNMKAAISNLTQVDRLMNDQHNIAQQQNAHLAENNAVLRTQRPNAVEEMEGKRVDPNDRRPRDNQSGEGEKKKDQRRKPNTDTESNLPSRNKGGHFVDFSA